MSGSEPMKPDNNPPTSSESERRLEELLAVFLAAEDAGQPLDTVEFLAKHPELEEELKTFFHDYERIVGLAAPLRAAAEAAFSTETDPRTETQLESSPRPENRFES